MSNGKELETPAVSAQEFIPEAVGALIALFEGPLHGVAFPGIDGDRLGERVKEVAAAHSALVEVQAQIEDLRTELSAAKERLIKDAERALAYARVYAGDNVELNESLAQIDLAPEGERRRKVRKTAVAEVAEGAEGEAKSGEEVRAPKRRSKAEANASA